MNSSSSSSSGPVASARASSRRLRSMRVSRAAGTLARPLEPDEREQPLGLARPRPRAGAGAGRRDGRPGRCPARSARGTAARAGRCGRCRARRPGARASPPISRPPSRTARRRAPSAPAITLNSVVLPDPFGPMIPDQLALLQAKLTSWTARTPPKPFDTRCTSSSGMPRAAMACAAPATRARACAPRARPRSHGEPRRRLGRGVGERAADGRSGPRQPPLGDGGVQRAALRSEPRRPASHARARGRRRARAGVPMPPRGRSALGERRRRIRQRRGRRTPWARPAPACRSCHCDERPPARCRCRRAGTSRAR